MSLTVEQAYAQIKQLENTGQLSLPQPKDTVDVGTIDVSTGAFTWNVPTFTQTTVIPPRPPQRTNTIINVTVGLVATKAVDLILRFDVKGVQVQKTGAATPATAAGVGLPGNTVFGLPSGITISGFPTLVNNAREILLDAGLAVSSAYGPESNTEPAVTTFPLTITIAHHPVVYVQLTIVRPPVLGIGAFTIPALPVTVIYAPPQGKQQKNSVTYTDMTSFTRSVTTTISQGNTVANADAFSPADYLSKIAGAIATIGGIAATGGGGAAAGGLLGALASALVGNQAGEEDTASIGDVLNLVSGEVNLVSTIFSAVDHTTNSNSDAVTNQDDHTVKLLLTDTSVFSSAAGLGPGVGDRIVYFKNVRVVWMALNGEVGIHVLGFERVSADSVQSLQSDLATATSGTGTNNSGLDAATLENLLNMDPFCVKRRLNVVSGPPLVGPPRFVPANPKERSGVGTGSAGDQFTVGFDKTLEDKTTQTSTKTTVTDEKPGFLTALLGGTDQETTTTVTLTNTLASDVQNEEVITNSVALFSQDATDPYDVLIFYDTTFGTYLYVTKGSPVLQGIGGIQQVFATGSTA
ncbi:MAG TPA: hypothetical protein VMS37_07225 [Verrucomicrobiae bacterium]|nr:hypothetical protein [Verrucomicrobiae bacterium]